MYSIESIRKNITGRTITGLMIVWTGMLLLIRNYGLDIPLWLDRWYVIVLISGILIGIKFGFSNPGAYFLTAAGTVFIIKAIFIQFSIVLPILPLLFIATGFYYLTSSVLKKSR